MDYTQLQDKELDHKMVQKMKEGIAIMKMIDETRVVSNKCRFYAQNCSDPEISEYFKGEAKKLEKAQNQLQQYYQKITKE